MSWNTLAAAALLLVASAYALPDPTSYTIAGRVLQADKKPFRGVAATVFLQAAFTPFTTRTQAGRDGKFKFKEVPQGTYLVRAAVSRVGELRKTVEVGPGTADAKGVVQVTTVFDGKVIRDNAVTAVELSVPAEAWRLYDKAQGRLEKRDFDGAVALLKEAVEIAPQFAVALNQLGTISFQAQNYGEAEGFFREAIRQDPDCYSPLLNLGGTLLKVGKPAEALPLHRRAVQINPGDALAQVQLGRNYFLLSQTEQAEEHLRMGKALDPAHCSSPQLTLVEIYARRKDDRGIVRELEEFLELHPDSKALSLLRRSLDAARKRLAIRKIFIALHPWR